MHDKLFHAPKKANFGIFGKIGLNLEFFNENGPLLVIVRQMTLDDFS